LTHFVETSGLAVLFLLIGLESAGIPLPGETALIAAAVLAEQGHFNLAAVIAIAATAAIVGDNGGYWAGRVGGRRLLRRWRFLERHSARVLPWAEQFFARHGGKTVFIGRFVAVLRITAAWMAGVSKMPWWRFLLWNAAGGIVWATGVSLLAYFGGRAAAEAVDRYGVIAAAVVIVLGAVAVVTVHLLRRRMLRTETKL
jgi:membrane-associated protein